MFNKDLILTRKLEIKTWHVQGSIAKAQDRKNMMLVLKYVDEFPDSTAKDLSMHLFFDNNARLVVAIRLLELSNSYGLTNSDGGHGAKYSLTDKGQDALTNKEVFIPEDGCWKLAVSNDPLLPHIIINIEAFSEPNAFSEIIGKDARSKLDNRLKNMESIPNWVKKCYGMDIIPHAGGTKKRIDSIDSKAEIVPNEISLTLQWNVTKGTICLKDNDKVLNQYSSPDISHNDIWIPLLKSINLAKEWDGNKENIALLYERLYDEAKKTMRVNIKFEHPTLPKYGKFENMTISGVPLRASNRDDAIKWANWRLHESINSFATTKKYINWSYEALEPFIEFDYNFTERDEFAQKLWSNSINSENEINKTKAWHLITASDWAL